MNMFKKIKESLVIVASALLLAVPVLAPVTAHAADIRNNLCGGVELNANTDAANCANVDSSGTGDANTLITNIINIFSLVVGIVAVIMIIVAGFRYITSGGNDSNVGTAKNTILYAVIGLVIVALAQIIVRFVLNKTKV